MTPIYDFGDCRDLRGRTPVDPAIFLQPGTCILGADGQSMMGNYSTTNLQRPAPGTVYDLDVYTRKIYECDGGPIFGSDGNTGTNPPMGPNQQIWTGRLAGMPALGTALNGVNGVQRMLRACVFAGGTTSGQWCPAPPDPTQPLYTRRYVIMEILKELGLPQPNIWLSVQGQGDVEPTNPGAATNQQNYTNLRTWSWADFRAVTGYSGPIMVGRGCHWTNESNVHTDRATFIRAGQNNAVIQGPGNMAWGPDDDIWVPDAQFRVDGVHWSNNGRYWSQHGNTDPTNGAPIGPGWLTQLGQMTLTA